MKYSIIVPVFNRPEEVDELLDSLTQQNENDFEVIVVEDGSSIPCKDVCEKYKDKLNIHYFTKENSGPGQSRNYGVERAKGEYIIILDSDVVLPSEYIRTQEGRLRCIWWTRQITPVFYRHPKGNKLFHDKLLHNRRNKRQQKKET